MVEKGGEGFLRGETGAGIKSAFSLFMSKEMIVYICNKTAVLSI